ncbi:MAG: DNA polymerase III subunit chi [Methylobacterium sp.]|nr:DNA polymerase III subunit chi [Methylobacterium sp.]
MTRIDFYFNVPDKLQQVVLLAAAAVPRRRNLLVLTPDASLAGQLESRIHTHQPTAFLPCCLADHPLVAETPVVIDWAGGHLERDDILINLCATQPAHFSRFRRLVELVGLGEEDRRQARARFRYYRDRGYEIRSCDRAEGDT